MRARWPVCIAGGAALLLALVITVVGAGTAGAAPGDSGVGYVRVVQAAPGAPSVDVYVDAQSTPIVSNLQFGQVTQYWTLPAGAHTLTITNAGQSVTNPYVTGPLTLTAGTNYTVAAVGDSQTAPALATFTDDNAITAGMAKVRVYHLSSDAGLAGVTASGQTVIPNIDFKQASDYLTLKPGNYTFDLLLQQGKQSTPLSVTLVPNKVTSVFAVGRIHGSSQETFKFVMVNADAVPTGLPQTGFAPHTTAVTTGAGAGVAEWALTLAVLLGAAAVALRQRFPAKYALLSVVRRRAAGR